MYNTKWTHQPIDLTKEQLARLNREVAELSDELDSASDLIFHTVFLNEDMNGPIVMIDGRDGYDDTVFLTYYETPEWVNLKDDIDDATQHNEVDL